MIKKLKDTLVEYRANAIVISALNRDSTKNNYVDMSAFKDSSMIEYTTDIAILFAFEDDKGNYTLKREQNSKDEDTIQFFTKCVKNRIGKMFNDKIEFHKLHQRFDFVEDTIINYKETTNRLNITILDDDIETEEEIEKAEGMKQRGFNFDD